MPPAHHWGHLFIPASHKKPGPSRPASVSLLLCVSIPLRASEVGDPRTSLSRLPEVEPLIKYDTILLQSLSQEVLRVRQQSCKVVPTSPLRFAQPLVAQCFRLTDKKCTFSGRKKSPRLGEERALEEKVWDPFWLLLGLIPAPPPCLGGTAETMPCSPGNKHKLLCWVFSREAERFPRQFLPLGQAIHVDHEGTNSSLRGGGAFRTGRPLSWRASSPSRAALRPSGRRRSPAVWPGQGASSGHL